MARMRSFPCKDLRFDRGHGNDAKVGVASQKICDTFSATIERNGGDLDLCVPVEHLKDDMGGAPNTHHSTGFQLLGIGFGKGDKLFKRLKWRVAPYRDRKGEGGQLSNVGDVFLRIVWDIGCENG